jgi:peptidoglycan/LPS O-acetylase OafA/YrhL
VDTSGRGHLATLTSLRFAAALLVFIVHAELLLDLHVRAAQVGFVGVSFFFVLSGFVLTWSRREGESAATFYWHRFARVWPSTALITLLLVALGARPASLVSDLLLLNGWRPGGMAAVAANPPSWSLGTEAFFYACFPLILVWAGRCRRLALTAACLVAVMAVATVAVAMLLGDNLQTTRFPPLRVGEFALGVLVALAMRRGWRLRLGMAPAVLVVVAAYWAALALWVPGAPWPLISVIVGPAFALLVMAAASRDIRGASTPVWMTTLGRWSFAFYLLHWPVLIAIREHTSGLTAVAIGFGVTVALAGLMFAAFERPVEHWLRSLLRSRPPIPAPAKA